MLYSTPWSKCISVCALTLFMTACSNRSPSANVSETSPTQVAARVNRQELTVHEINTLLPALSLAAGETAEQSRFKVLEQMINQSLAQQKALAWQLDQTPEVIRQLEAARRGIMAQAWADRVLQDLIPPSETEQRRFYDTHPDWFAQRKLYQIQDLWAAIPAAEHKPWQTWLKQNPSYERVVDKLKSQKIRFAATPIIMGAQQLSASELTQLAQTPKGQRIAIERTASRPDAIQLWWLIDARTQPVSWEQAQPVIEGQLLQQQRQTRLRQEMDALRTQADIQYVGAFASANQRAQP
jgi:EpsD family peptidyl-prolyl cis-trans isomerase